jgi:myosin heavy subunit
MEPSLPHRSEPIASRASGHASAVPAAEVLNPNVDDVPQWMLYSVAQMQNKVVSVNNETLAHINTVIENQNELTHKVDGIARSNIAQQAWQDEQFELSQRIQAGCQQVTNDLRELTQQMNDTHNQVHILEDTSTKHEDELFRLSQKLAQQQSQIDLLQSKGNDLISLRAEVQAITKAMADAASPKHHAGTTQQALTAARPPAGHAVPDFNPIKSAQPEVLNGGPIASSSIQPGLMARAAVSRSLAQPSAEQPPTRQEGTGTAFVDPQNDRPSFTSTEAPHVESSPKNGTTIEVQAAPVTKLAKTSSHKAVTNRTAARKVRSPDQNRTWLQQHLEQAWEEYPKYPRDYPHIRDIEFIWRFIDAIPDKEFGKQFQGFLLSRFGTKFIRKTRENTRSKRSISIVGLRWKSFAEAVDEFAKQDVEN